MIYLTWDQSSKLKDKQDITENPTKKLQNAEIKILANRGLAESDFEQSDSEFQLNTLQ